MIVSSMYSVFCTNDMDDMLARCERSGALTVKHHIKTEELDYYVMKDASGNSTDFIQFKKEKVTGGFYALRINVNNFDQMERFMIEKGYSRKGEAVENDSFKFAQYVSSVGEPNVMLFYHKKGTTTDAWEAVMKFMHY